MSDDDDTSDDGGADGDGDDDGGAEGDTETHGEHEAAIGILVADLDGGSDAIRSMWSEEAIATIVAGADLFNDMFDGPSSLRDGIPRLPAVPVPGLPPVAPGQPTAGLPVVIGAAPPVAIWPPAPLLPVLALLRSLAATVPPLPVPVLLHSPAAPPAAAAASPAADVGDTKRGGGEVKLKEYKRERDGKSSDSKDGKRDDDYSEFDDRNEHTVRTIEQTKRIARTAANMTRIARTIEDKIREYADYDETEGINWASAYYRRVSGDGATLGPLSRAFTVEMRPVRDRCVNTERWSTPENPVWYDGGIKQAAWRAWTRFDVLDLDPLVDHLKEFMEMKEDDPILPGSVLVLVAWSMLVDFDAIIKPTPEEYAVARPDGIHAILVTDVVAALQYAGLLGSHAPTYPLIPSLLHPRLINRAQQLFRNAMEHMKRVSLMSKDIHGLYARLGYESGVKMSSPGSIASALFSNYVTACKCAEHIAGWFSQRASEGAILHPHIDVNGMIRRLSVAIDDHEFMMQDMEGLEKRCAVYNDTKDREDYLVTFESAAKIDSASREVIIEYHVQRHAVLRSMIGYAVANDGLSFQTRKSLSDIYSGLWPKAYRNAKAESSHRLLVPIIESMRRIASIDQFPNGEPFTHTESGSYTVLLETVAKWIGHATGHVQQYEYDQHGRVLDEYTHQEINDAIKAYKETVKFSRDLVRVATQPSLLDRTPFRGAPDGDLEDMMRTVARRAFNRRSLLRNGPDRVFNDLMTNSYPYLRKLIHRSALEYCLRRRSVFLGYGEPFSADRPLMTNLWAMCARWFNDAPIQESTMGDDTADMLTYGDDVYHDFCAAADIESVYAEEAVIIANIDAKTSELLELRLEWQRVIAAASEIQTHEKNPGLAPAWVIAAALDIPKQDKTPGLAPAWLMEATSMTIATAMKRGAGHALISLVEDKEKSLAELRVELARVTRVLTGLKASFLLRASVGDVAIDRTSHSQRMAFYRYAIGVKAGMFEVEPVDLIEQDLTAALLPLRLSELKSGKRTEHRPAEINRYLELVTEYNTTMLVSIAGNAVQELGSSVIDDEMRACYANPSTEKNAKRIALFESIESYPNRIARILVQSAMRLQPLPLPAGAAPPLLPPDADREAFLVAMGDYTRWKLDNWKSATTAELERKEFISRFVQLTTEHADGSLEPPSQKKQDILKELVAYTQAAFAGDISRVRKRGHDDDDEVSSYKRPRYTATGDGKGQPYEKDARPDGYIEEFSLEITDRDGVNLLDALRLGDVVDAPYATFDGDVQTETFHRYDDRELDLPWVYQINDIRPILRDLPAHLVSGAASAAITMYDLVKEEEILRGVTLWNKTDALFDYRTRHLKAFAEYRRRTREAWDTWKPRSDAASAERRELAYRHLSAHGYAHGRADSLPPSVLALFSVPGAAAPASPPPAPAKRAARDDDDDA